MNCSSNEIRMCIVWIFVFCLVEFFFPLNSRCNLKIYALLISFFLKVYLDTIWNDFVTIVILPWCSLPHAHGIEINTHTCSYSHKYVHIEPNFSQFQTKSLIKFPLISVNESIFFSFQHVLKYFFFSIFYKSYVLMDYTIFDTFSIYIHRWSFDIRFRCIDSLNFAQKYNAFCGLPRNSRNISRISSALNKVDHWRSDHNFSKLITKNQIPRVSVF